MNEFPFLKIDENHPDHNALRIDIPAAIQYLENSINDDRYTSVWNLKVSNIIRLFTECKRLGLKGISPDVPEMETDRIYHRIQAPPMELNFGYQPDLDQSEVLDINEYRDVLGADHPLFFLADYLEQFFTFAKGQVLADFPKLEKVRASIIDSENNKGKLIEARRNFEKQVIYGDLDPQFNRIVKDIESRLKYLEDSSQIVEVSTVTSQTNVEVLEDIKKRLESYFIEQGTVLTTFIKDQHKIKKLKKPAGIAPLLLALQPYINISLIDKGSKEDFIKDLNYLLNERWTPQGVQEALKRENAKLKNPNIKLFEKELFTTYPLLNSGLT